MYKVPFRYETSKPLRSIGAVFLLVYLSCGLMRVMLQVLSQLVLCA